MLKGRNIRGYTAELIDHIDPVFTALFPSDNTTKKLVRIDKDEFLKVVVGLITLDTPDFINHYFTINPATKDSANIHLAFGVTLLQSGNNQFVDRSIPLLRKALHLLQAGGHRDQEHYAANRLHLALLLEYYILAMQKDRAGTEAILAELKGLWNRYGKEEIMARNQAIDYYRMGLIASDAWDLNPAILFFTKAVDKDPEYQVAYIHRAVGAVQDATDALELNAKARKSLAKQKIARHKRDQIGQLKDALVGRSILTSGKR